METTPQTTGIGVLISDMSDKTVEQDCTLILMRSSAVVFSPQRLLCLPHHHPPCHNILLPPHRPPSHSPQLLMIDTGSRQVGDLLEGLRERHAGSTQ